MKVHMFCEKEHYENVECIECIKMNKFDEFLESGSKKLEEFIKETTIKMYIEQPELYKEMMEN